ncbi:MAG: threonine--tRNA ligase [Chloroflexi bacterium]|nr:threonine--tRNA ligase [Chloroflexota bacterium]
MAEMSDLERMRHSAAHVMAEAVLHLFPEAKFAIGPPIEDGFYYDFDLPRSLTPEDLGRIEQKMAEIVRLNAPFVRSTMPREQAISFFRDRNQPYKIELIEGIDEDPVGIYQSNTFVDLCRGPHVPSTGKLGPFKLLSVAGAYWRGDEHRPMLQRIYGTAWPTREELDAYLERLAEAQRRDHRRLGRELGLFSVHDEVGAGLIFWHPRGGRLRTVIEDYWRKRHYQAGYELVYTPHVGKANLWETSGHLGFYRENMFAPMDLDGQEYFIRPMNCPFHIKIYQSAVHSYRELPIRLGELGTVYRYERPGVLHGLLRVRGFTQDDAHIFCRPDQVEDEIFRVLELNRSILSAFGFSDYRVYVATRPDKYVGEPADWDRATLALQRAVDRLGISYEVDEGGGAFYGPKIDWKIRDALGRSWQCSTVQFDFNLPERFDLSYVGDDGRPHRPYMVHRALLGSLERFLGVLIEQYAGAFPVWLAPYQAVVIPIADRHLLYAEEVAHRLAAAEIRVDVDARREKLNAKIRDAQLQKVPYMLVVGDAEAQNGTAAVRLRSGENLGQRPLDEFIALVSSIIRTRSLSLTDPGVVVGEPQAAGAR